MWKGSIIISNKLISIDDYFRKKFNILFYWKNKRQYDFVFEYLNIQPNDDILDIGFGDSLYFFNKKVSKLMENNLFPLMASGLKVMKNGKLRFILPGDNRSTFEENKFNKIYTINTIFFSNEIEKYLLDIIRILKPNGIFINVINIRGYIDNIIYKKNGYKEYSVKEMEEMTRKYGMEIIETVEIKKNKSYCIISKK
jgi:ubiquinone/menaquinone biosynthesis C-methylase UbiE